MHWTVVCFLFLLACGSSCEGMIPPFMRVCIRILGLSLRIKSNIIYYHFVYLGWFPLY